PPPAPGVSLPPVVRGGPPPRPRHDHRRHLEIADGGARLRDDRNRHRGALRAPWLAHWSLAPVVDPGGFERITVPLRAPGTAPRTRMTCSSGRTATTSRLRVVTRSAP